MKPGPLKKKGGDEVVVYFGRPILLTPPSLKITYFHQSDLIFGLDMPNVQDMPGNESTLM